MYVACVHFPVLITQPEGISFSKYTCKVSYNTLPPQPYLLSSASHSHLLQSSLLLLLQKPGHTPIHTLLQRPQRLIPQHTLRLCNVIIPRHGGHRSPHFSKRRRFPNDAEEDFAQRTQHEARALAKLPHTLCAGSITRGLPHGAGEIPKVAGRVVCDDEDFAVDFFVVERLGGGRCGEEESLGGEEVRVGDVAYVGEVEEVGVVAELDVRLLGAVGLDEAVEGLDVAFAEYACGAEGGGEELGGAVCREDDFFGGRLRWLASVL